MVAVSRAGTRSGTSAVHRGGGRELVVTLIHLDGVQPGDEVLVYAELPEGRGQVHLSTWGARQRSDVRPSGRRTARRARAGEGQDSEPRRSRESATTAGAPSSKQKIEQDLQRKHRALVKYTALLVLETDADYARFDIDRRALTGHLTGGRRASSRGLKRTGDAGDSSRRERGRGEDTTAYARRAPGASNQEPGDTLVRRTCPDGGRAAGDPHRGQRALRQTTELRAPGVGRAERGAVSTRRGQADVHGRKRGSMGDPRHGPAAACKRSRLLAPASVAAAPPSAANPAGRHARAGRGRHDGQTSRRAGYPTARWAFRIDLSEWRGGSGAPAAAGADMTAGAPGMGQLGGRSREDEKGGAYPVHRQDATVKARLAARDTSRGVAMASSWRRTSPGTYSRSCRSAETSEAPRQCGARAARAYGPIIDLSLRAPTCRRFAGERLEHVTSKERSARHSPSTRSTRRARDRPDHPASHRLAAFARVRRGENAGAFDILAAGAARHYPDGRFRGRRPYLARGPGPRRRRVDEGGARAQTRSWRDSKRRAARIENGPSIRFVLNWETDANDVDFHIYDARAGTPTTPSQSPPERRATSTPT